jgi:LuxR family maltose regulon positive regulatory protein
MEMPLLRTKLYIPPPRPGLVPRPRLIERLDAGIHRKLTLISAPAGFGKTTLLSEWVHHIETGFFPENPVSSLFRSVAWLSLDEGDNDPARFLTYFVAALQRVDPNIGQAAQAMLQALQPPPPEAILTGLINEIAGLLDAPSTGLRQAQADSLGQGLTLVLDDYHVIESQAVDRALTFFLDHLSPRMQLVIATRVDPPLHLARLRGRRQLTELRTADLRFTQDEATAFLNQVMGLNLSAEDAAAPFPGITVCTKDREYAR